MRLSGAVKENNALRKKILSPYFMLLWQVFLILPYVKTSMGKWEYFEKLANKLVWETISHEKSEGTEHRAWRRENSGKCQGKKSKFLYVLKALFIERRAPFVLTISKKDIWATYKEILSKRQNCIIMEGVAILVRSLAHKWENKLKKRKDKGGIYWPIHSRQFWA